jgi:hypothetical protein
VVRDEFPLKSAKRRQAYKLHGMIHVFLKDANNVHRPFKIFLIMITCRVR